MALELPHLGLRLFGIDRDALLWVLEYLELSDIGRLDSVSPCIVRPPIHLELPLSLPHDLQATMNHGNRMLLHASLIFLKFSVLSISGSEIKKMQYVLLRGIKVQKIEFRNIKDTVLVTLAILL